MARRKPIELQKITFNDVKPGQIIKVIKDSKPKYYLVINTKTHINLVEVVLEKNFIYAGYHDKELNELDITNVYDSKNGNCIIYKSYDSIEMKGSEEDDY